MVCPVRHATRGKDCLHLLSALVAVSRFLVTSAPTIYRQREQCKICFSVGPVKDGERYGVLKCKRTRTGDSTERILRGLKEHYGFVDQVLIGEQRRTERGESGSRPVAEMVALGGDEILCRDEAFRRLKALVALFHNPVDEREPCVQFKGAMALPFSECANRSFFDEAEEEELIRLFMKWARRHYEESHLHLRMNLRSVFNQLLHSTSETLGVTSVASSIVPDRQPLRSLLKKLRRWTQTHEATDLDALLYSPMTPEHPTAVINLHAAPMHSPVPSLDAESLSTYRLQQCTNEPMDFTTDAAIDLSSHRTETESRSASLPMQEWPLDLSVRREDE